MIRPLDPRHDRDSKLLPARPPAAVENVLPNQGEEGLHRSIVTSRADPAHRPDDAAAVQGASEFLRSELTAAIGVHHTPGHISAATDHSRLEGIDSWAFILELIE